MMANSSKGSSRASAGSEAAGERGLVVAAFGRRGILEDSSGTRLPFLVASRKVTACCGDEVRWDLPAGSDTAVVAAVEPRRSELRRQPQRHSAPEILAANVTHLVVVMAPEPAPDPFLVDRYLCAAALMHARAAIAWNKADLQREPLPDLVEWEAIGYPVLRLSTRTREGLEGLESWLGRGMGILVGQSGTGKSSLLNALVPAAEALTGSLSDASGEGRHTTTASWLLTRPDGGRLIDTPGVRDFVPAIPDRRDVARGYVEISRLGAGCRFADCLHLKEPGCAVQGALATRELSARRYESYRRMMLLAAQAEERSAPR